MFNMITCSMFAGVEDDNVERIGQQCLHWFAYLFWWVFRRCTTFDLVFFCFFSCFIGSVQVLNFHISSIDVSNRDPRSKESKTLDRKRVSQSWNSFGTIICWIFVFQIDHIHNQNMSTADKRQTNLFYQLNVQFSIFLLCWFVHPLQIYIVGLYIQSLWVVCY